MDQIVRLRYIASPGDSRDVLCICMKRPRLGRDKTAGGTVRLRALGENEEQMLQTLGLDPIAEQVYRGMLTNPQDGVPELAQRLGLRDHLILD